MNDLIVIAWMFSPVFLLFVALLLIELKYTLERKKQLEEEMIRDKERERRRIEREEWLSRRYGDRK